MLIMSEITTNKKHYLSKIILNIIKDLGPISRSEIRKITGIRLSTITDISKELLNDNIIIETGSLKERNISKRKKDLILNENYCNIIGIDIRPDVVLVILTNFKGRILFQNSIPIKFDYTKNQILKVIFTLLEEVLTKSGKQKILGIGIAVSGIIDRENQTILISSQLPNWKNVALKKIIEERFLLPVFMEDRVIAKIYAEKWFGEALKHKNGIFAEIGECFGISIISNNRILKGANGIIGELGHFNINSKNHFPVIHSRY
jgi:DNA-binding Lrp family transcriptional regulator